jgi:hypothetical protein
MLETEIRELFERQVAPELPTARISIAAAHRTGRVRLRLRRTAAAVTPVAAAAAVLAILLSGSLFAGTGAAPAATGHRPGAPRLFSTLRPYVRLTWLPRGSVIWKYILWPSGDYLSNSGPDRHDLNVAAAGQCHRGGANLICGRSKYPIGRVIGRAGGQPVYFLRVGTNFGEVAWQYAPGGWAQLDSLATPAAERTALRMAQGARFGPDVAGPVRFPFQLTGEPATWTIYYDSWTVSKHVPSRTIGISGPAGHNLDVPQITVQPPGTMQTCERLVDYPASDYQASYQTIRGFPALLTLGVGQGAAFGRSLCIPDADGVLLVFTGHANSSMVSLFEHHVRLFGANQAQWTTKPLG